MICSWYCGRLRRKEIDLSVIDLVDYTCTFMVSPADPFLFCAYFLFLLSSIIVTDLVCFMAFRMEGGIGMG